MRISFEGITAAQADMLERMVREKGPHSFGPIQAHVVRCEMPLNKRSLSLDVREIPPTDKELIAERTLPARGERMSRYERKRALEACDNDPYADDPAYHMETLAGYLRFALATLDEWDNDRARDNAERIAIAGMARKLAELAER